jgi:hypothetical protein
MMSLQLVVEGRKMLRSRPATRLGVAAFLAIAFVAAPASAQLGRGWTPTTYTKKIHLDDDAGLQIFNWSASKSVCTPACADYSYDSATDTETFRLLDGRTNRSEIRLVNEYSDGIRQFEGYVTFYAPLNDESLFQIFGSTDGATLCMMRGYSSNGGKIRVVGGIGDIQYNTYGVEHRINVIHNQNKYVQFYVDGVLKGEFNENEQVDNYWKYGDYGTVATDTVPAVVKWRAVRTFRDGFPAGSVSAPLGAYEAENAVLSGPLVSANQAGFSGTGFADFANLSGDSIQWTVNQDRSGRYDLSLRYALSSGSRSMQLEVNGVVQPTLNFSATGAWTTWQDLTLPAIPLASGVNTIRLFATGTGGPNIDRLLATASHTTLGDFNGDGTVDSADYVVWRESRGARVVAGAGADANLDGFIDDADLALWRSNFGSILAAGAAAGSNAAVPEPVNTMWIAVLFLFSFGGRVRERVFLRGGE